MSNVNQSPTPTKARTRHVSLRRFVALEQPLQPLRKRLLDNPVVDMPTLLAEHVPVIVALCLQRGRRAAVGHHPVVVGLGRQLPPNILPRQDSDMYAGCSVQEDVMYGAIQN